MFGTGVKRALFSVCFLAALFGAHPNVISFLNHGHFAAGPSLALADDGALEKEAFDAAKELGTIDAWEAFLKNFPEGFRADLARAYIASLTGNDGPPTNNASDTATRQSPAGPGELATVSPGAVPIGKWPERLTYDGNAIWVSESGQRTIAAFDPTTGEVTSRLNVGRLPVDMVAKSDGTVFSLVETDNTVWVRRPGSSSARKFASIPRCADLMALGDHNLWVVSNVDCSAPSVLYRVNDNNGRASKLISLEASPTDMKFSNGYLHIGHGATSGRTPFISVVNVASGDAAATPDLEIHYPRMAANTWAVFAGGGLYDQETGRIRRLPAGSANFDADKHLDETVAVMTATDDYLIAVGRRGTIWVMAQDTLATLKTIRTRGMSIAANDVLVVGDTLYVAASRGNNTPDDNVIYAIAGWMPGQHTTAPPHWGQISQPARPQPRPVAAPTPSKKPPPLKCGTNYKLRKGKCVLIQNCGKNAYRNVEGDCHCKKNYEMHNGRCRWRQNKHGFEIEPWKKPGCKSLDRKCKRGDSNACMRYEERCQVN